MSACEFGSKLRSRDMNERQAFDWAVRSLRLYDWKSYQSRFQVNGDSLTIRELCERAKKLDLQVRCPAKNGIEVIFDYFGRCNLP